MLLQLPFLQGSNEPFNGLQGRDLHGSNAPDAVIVEEDSQRTMIGFDRPQRVRTVVPEIPHVASARRGLNELYDLENDLHEMQNLFDDPASSGVRSELMEIMLRKMIEQQDKGAVAGSSGVVFGLDV